MGTGARALGPPEAGGLPGDPYTGDPYAAVIARLQGSHGESSYVILSDDQRTLELIRTRLFQTPRTWHFDEAPAGPSGCVPRWIGYLVRADAEGRLSTVRLGDRATLVERWNDLVRWLEPGDLSTILARYFGADAGISEPQEVIMSAEAFVAELAAGEDLGEIARPHIEADSATGQMRLIFLARFLESTHDGYRYGICQWTAQWGPQAPVSWRGIVTRRGIRAARYS